MTRYGATVEEWLHFSDVLGLTEHLLPVVSNPNARISPHSSLKGIGKTPSVYNTKGQVVGFPKWTGHRATAGEVRRWMQNPDYGICVQTRGATRALDVDVDDPRLASEIVRTIQAAAGPLPVRSRPNSGKCLLLIRIDEPIRKRRLQVQGGIIELLGDGQQFIAAGTHPSGVRYVWSRPELLG